MWIWNRISNVRELKLVLLKTCWWYAKKLTTEFLREDGKREKGSSDTLTMTSVSTFSRHQRERKQKKRQSKSTHRRIYFLVRNKHKKVFLYSGPGMFFIVKFMHAEVSRGPTDVMPDYRQQLCGGFQQWACGLSDRATHHITPPLFLRLKNQCHKFEP
jgi:hypothetical protein